MPTWVCNRKSSFGDIRVPPTLENYLCPMYLNRNSETREWSNVIWMANSRKFQKQKTEMFGQPSITWKKSPDSLELRARIENTRNWNGNPGWVTLMGSRRNLSEKIVLISCRTEKAHRNNHQMNRIIIRVHEEPIIKSHDEERKSTSKAHGTVKYNNASSACNDEKKPGAYFVERIIGLMNVRNMKHSYNE